MCRSITKEKQNVSQKGRKATSFPAWKLKECISTELEGKKTHTSLHLLQKLLNLGFSVSFENISTSGSISAFVLHCKLKRKKKKNEIRIYLLSELCFPVFYCFALHDDGCVYKQEPRNGGTRNKSNTKLFD